MSVCEYFCPRYRGTEDLIGSGQVAENRGWDLAPWTSDFVDICGSQRGALAGSRDPPRFRTRMKLLWDERGLYVGADMEDPELFATQSERNAFIWQYDNDFEVRQNLRKPDLVAFTKPKGVSILKDVKALKKLSFLLRISKVFINPAGTRENYYEFEVNALNTIFELTLSKPYSDGGVARHGTNLPGLVSAVHVNGKLGISPKSWSVTVFFPFDDLLTLLDLDKQRFWPSPSLTTWRLNASRVQWHTVRDHQSSGVLRRDPARAKWGDEDNWVWSPQGQIDMHIPERWGHLRFVS